MALPPGKVGTLARQRSHSTAPAERGWKPPRFGRDFRVALAWPGYYRAGMSALGFQTILYGLASLPGVLAQRVFLDEKGPGLRLFDAALHPRQVDLFAFSVAAENDYPQILTLLSLAGFPLRSRDRGKEFPVVVGGGIAPSLNPEPLAPFMDCLVIGEGEEVLAPLVDLLREERDSPRPVLLEKLAGIAGVYVPSLYRCSYREDGVLEKRSVRRPAPRRVARAVVEDLDSHPAVSRIVAPGSEFENLLMVEVNRGCGRGCRFCAAGYLCRPLRHRSLGSLADSLEEGAVTMERFGLLGSAVADHPDILKLAEMIVERGWKLSVSSLRLDRLKPELLDLLRRGGCRTVTVAPETGSERLRWVINKRISDERILTAAEEVARAGIPNLKLYFMVGLPTEGPEDRAAIPALLRKVRHQVVAGSRARRRMGTISVSLGCFVPKAWTPFQWHPFCELQELKDSLLRLTREIRKIPNVRVSHDLPKWAYVQALLSRGDRRTADVLEGLHRLGGNWRRALRESPVNPDFFVYRQREKEELFPWDVIDTGLKKENLRREYERATSAGEEEK